MLSIPQQSRSYTLINVIEYYQLLSTELLPIESQILAAAMAGFFYKPSNDVRENQYKFRLNFIVHCYDLSVFKHEYKSSYNIVQLQRFATILKQKLSDKSIIRNDVLDEYCPIVDPERKLAMLRDHLKTIAMECTRSSLPFKLYSLIRLRTINKRGYARINQEIAARLFGCNQRQVYRAQSELIRLKLVYKTELLPHLRNRHGVMISIIGHDEMSDRTVMRRQ